MSAIVARSTLTCPACGRRQDMGMPEDACPFFHECAGCKTLPRREFSAAKSRPSV